MQIIILNFRWCKTRAGTYSCRLWLNGWKTEHQQSGLGYDIRGTVLGMYMTENMQDKLKELVKQYEAKKLDIKDRYVGIAFFDDKIILNGGMGYRECVNLLQEMGYVVETTQDDDILVIVDQEGN